MSRSIGIATIHAALLKLTDGLIILGMYYWATVLRGTSFSEKELYLLLGSIGLYYLLASIIGLYQLKTFSHLYLNFKKQLATWLSVCFMVVLWLFVRKESDDFSRIVMISWMISVPILLLTIRPLISLISFNNGHKKVAIAVVGNDDTSTQFLNNLNTLQWPWINLYGVYDFTPSILLSNNTPTKPIHELLSAVKAGYIKDVYITLTLNNKVDIENLLVDLADTTASVYIIPDLFVTNIMKSNLSEFAGLSIINVFTAPVHGINGIIKRSLDIILASLILLLIWPIMLAIAIAIKLTSKGPILFKQRRYGLDGQVINVWKFRSMTVCEDGPHVPQAQKNDVRITRLGKFLRKTSLDELPQFINVLQGVLSVVGPRPHANAHNEEYRKQITGYMLRHKVKPGITGLAQINGWRGETDTLVKMEKRIEYDIKYIQTWSVGLDLKIVFLTLFHGFIDKNAY